MTRTRSQLAQLLGAQAQEIEFTGGGSEADTLAVRGVTRAAPAGRRQVITLPTSIPRCSVMWWRTATSMGSRAGVEGQRTSLATRRLRTGPPRSTVIPTCLHDHSASRTGMRAVPHTKVSREAQLFVVRMSSSMSCSCCAVTSAIAARTTAPITRPWRSRTRHPIAPVV